MNAGYYKIIIVPPGKIGLDIQPAKAGGVVIKKIKPSCSFKDQVSIDDRIVTVDGRKVITAACLRGVNSNADRHLAIISKEADVNDATFQSLHILPSTRRVVSIYSAAETVSSSESESLAIRLSEKSLSIDDKTPAVTSRTIWPTRSGSCTDESGYNAAQTVAPSLYSGAATDAPSFYTAGKTVAPSFADESVYTGALTVALTETTQKQKDAIPVVLEVKMKKSIYEQEVANVEDENNSRTTHGSRSTDVFEAAYVANDEREIIHEKRLYRGGSSSIILSSVDAGCTVTREDDSNAESGNSYNAIMHIGAQGEPQDAQDTSGRGDDFGEIGIEQVLEAHNDFQDTITDAYSNKSGIIEQVYSDLSKSNLNKGTRKKPRQESRLKKLISWRSKEPSSATSSKTASSSSSSAVSGSKNANTEFTPPINNCSKYTSKSMWKAAIDKSSGKTYYFHINTKEVTWSKPTERTENAPLVSNENEKAEAERQEHDGAFFDLEIRRTVTNISALTGVASARESVTNERVNQGSARNADRPVNNVHDLHEGMIGLCVNLDAVKSMDCASLKCNDDKDMQADDRAEEKDDDGAVSHAVAEGNQLECLDETSAKMITHEPNQDVECDEAQYLSNIDIHSSFWPNVEEVAEEISSQRTESPSTPRPSKISQVMRIFDKKVPQEPTTKIDQSVFSISPANEGSGEGEHEARLKRETSNADHLPQATNIKIGMTFLHTPTAKMPSLRRTIPFPSPAKKSDCLKPAIDRDVTDMTEGNDQLTATCNKRNSSPKAADSSAFWYDDQSLNEAFANGIRGIISMSPLKKGKTGFFGNGSDGNNKNTATSQAETNDEHEIAVKCDPHAPAHIPILKEEIIDTEANSDGSCDVYATDQHID